MLSNAVIGEIQHLARDHRLGSATVALVDLDRLCDQARLANILHGALREVLEMAISPPDFFETMSGDRDHRIAELRKLIDTVK